MVRLTSDMTIGNRRPGVAATISHMSASPCDDVADIARALPPLHRQSQTWQSAPTLLAPSPCPRFHQRHTSQTLHDWCLGGDRIRHDNIGIDLPHCLRCRLGTRNCFPDSHVCSLPYNLQEACSASSSRIMLRHLEGHSWAQMPHPLQ